MVAHQDRMLPAGLIPGQGTALGHNTKVTLLGLCVPVGLSALRAFETVHAGAS